MILKNKVYNPFIRTKDTTTRVMTDVIIALVPCIFMSYLAFGMAALQLLAVSVGTAIVTEYVFSFIFLNRPHSVTDGSAIVTGILLAFTLGAFTPLPVVAFGAAMAVIFGKLLWGGVGRNLFNPALVGREFMAVFFPAVMTSGSIWYSYEHVNLSELNLLGIDWADQLIFKPAGAMGEYSILGLALGGLYLLWRRRISWHIPFHIFVIFTICLLLTMNYYPEKEVTFSLGGLMLGALFMATDMPSSATTTWGKCYYGVMIGLTAFLFIIYGVRYEYMSYSILLLNGFSRLINWVFRPRIWGQKLDLLPRIGWALLLTLGILVAGYVVVQLHETGTMQYLLYAFVLYCIIRFIVEDAKRNRIVISKAQEEAK